MSAAQVPALILVLFLVILVLIFRGLRWLWRNRHERFADIARRYQFKARAKKAAQIAMWLVTLAIALAIGTEMFIHFHRE